MQDKMTGFFLMMFFSMQLYGQNIYKGVVVSSEDSIPLSGVTITVADKAVASTDEKGCFQFSSRLYVIEGSFSHVGYQSKSGSYTPGRLISVTLNRSNPFLPGAVVKAFERNTSLKNMPASVALLDKAELERYSGASILQAVNTVPGVKMDERSPGSYRLSIRGSSLRSPFGVRNVKVYWNGIPFTDASGNTYINQLGFGNIGRIEIIKGPTGSMYGAGTGGVVLLNSPVAGGKENSLSVHSLAGSYGLYESGVLYKKGSENVNYSLQYAHQQSDGWRNHTATRRDMANYTGNFDISKKQSIAANIFYSDLYYETPGGLTLAQLAADPRQARPAGGIFKSAEEQRAALYLKTMYAGFLHQYQFDSRWSNTTSIYMSATRFKNPTIRNYERKTEQGMGARTILQYHRNNLNVHAGGEYQYGFTATRTFGNRSGNIDTLQYDDEITGSQYNFFLQADISLLDNFIINAGLSYNNYRYGFSRLNQLPIVGTSRVFDPVVAPRISLLVKLAKVYSVYASISKGYSPASIDEVHPSDGNFNKELNAEDAINYEMGVKGEPVKNKLFFEASLYSLQLHNTIVVRRDTSGADYFVNAGNTGQKGVELSLNYYPVRNSPGFLQDLKLWGNYTYIHARFKNYQQGTIDHSGNKLTGTAPNVWVLGVDAFTKPGFYANLTYSFTDSIPLNDANTFFGTRYGLLMGRIGYKKEISKVVQGELYFSFDRSFNDPFSLGNDLNAAGNRYFNPSAPGSYVGGLRVKFNL